MMDPIVQGASVGLSKSAAELVSSIYGAIASRAGVTRDIAKLSFNRGFETYVQQAQERCRYTKTLINRFEPVSVEKLYVDLRFKVGRTLLENSGLVGKMKQGRQVIVTGIAGSGKSLTLKKIFLDLIKEGDIIPVFVELRNLTEYSGSLLEFICDDIARFTGAFTEEGLIFGLRSGHITLLLDGFDEVPKAKMAVVEREIHEMIASAPKAKIILSGRPHPRYYSWHSVEEARVENLSKKQVLELVNNIEFSEEAKSNFSKRIENGLFESHQNLITNPLLCSLMLLTVEEFSEVPASMHVYYRKAFEVLLRKHDSLKPQYVREFNVQMTEDAFRRVFEAFCYFSFLEGRFLFDEKDILPYFEEALSYESSETSSRKYLDDVVDNVCIILRDGDNLSFIHRSFQEYFAASFIITRQHAKLFDLVNEIGDTFLDAQVLSFMVEMNAEALERGYLLPAAEKLIDYVADRKTQAEKFGSVAAGIFVSARGRCSPILDIKGRQWHGAGLLGVTRISKRPFELPSLKADLYERLKRDNVLRSVKGRKGFSIKSSDSYVFENVCEQLKLGDALLEYLKSVFSEFSKKETRRNRLLTKRRDNR